MMVVYGTKVFTKFKGYFGEKEECPCCHKSYKKAYVKYTTWAQLECIPLFPVKMRYYKMCPICGDSIELKCKQAKNEMVANESTENQQLETYAKHILSNKPSGFLSTDMSYELWVRDLTTGEEICISTGIAKSLVKAVKKERGLKKIKIINV